MAEIFKAPSEIALPKIDFANFNHKKMIEDEENYLENLKTHIKSCGYKGKNVGEIVRLPQADGYAQYMVLSMRPLRLIHLELGDAWNSQFAELLTAKKVNEMIEGAKRMAELFGH